MPLSPPDASDADELVTLTLEPVDWRPSAEEP